jgi:hypothetical protein
LSIVKEASRILQSSSSEKKESVGIEAISSVFMPAKVYLRYFLLGKKISLKKASSTEACRMGVD